jgi:hypothetical protein
LNARALRGAANASLPDQEEEEENKKIKKTFINFYGFPR